MIWRPSVTRLYHQVRSTDSGHSRTLIVGALIYRNFQYRLPNLPSLEKWSFKEKELFGEESVFRERRQRRAGNRVNGADGADDRICPFYHL